MLASGSADDIVAEAPPHRLLHNIKPERDTFGRLGAAAVDQGTALAGFARQGQRKNQNNKHMDSFVLKVFELSP